MLRYSDILELCDGKLPSSSMFGDYPLFYVTNGKFLLCANCANQLSRDDIACQNINWSQHDILCDFCGTTIESAGENADQC